MELYYYEEKDGHKFKLITEEYAKMLNANDSDYEQKQTCVKCGVKLSYYKKSPFKCDK